MVSYPQLEHYLEMPPAPTKRVEGDISDIVKVLIGEIKKEAPLPLELSHILDLTCTREVFNALDFEEPKLWSLVRKTNLLPRQILGINAPRIVYIHNPCMIKLAAHISKLSSDRKNQASKVMRTTAIFRAKLREKCGIGI